MSDPSPTPLIVDTSVLTAITRTDPGVINLMQIYDSRSQPLVIPALAITGASLDARDEAANDLLAGLELLPSKPPGCGTVPPYALVVRSA